MRKVYYLSSCSTCKRILSTINTEDNNIDLQDIKTIPITAEQLAAMQVRSGSYESLFSRRAMKYRAMGLHEKELTEQDYRQLILEEYTFLKRPVFIIDDNIFIGNAKKTIAALQEKLAVTS